MRKLTRRIFSVSIISVLLLTSQPAVAEATVMAGDVPLLGFSLTLSNFYEGVEETSEIDTTELFGNKAEIPDNIAIANVNESLNIREKAGTKYNIIGYLPKNAYCIVHEVNDGWAKITSGEISGYVSTEYLYMGEEGREKAEELSKLVAIVSVSSGGYANLRSTPSTEDNSNVIAKVYKGEELIVLSENVISKDDSEAESWVKVQFDETIGYIAKHLVKVQYNLKTAVKAEVYTTDPLRAKVVTTAKKYLGLKYVWGGNSLKSGVDCSGFVREVFEECGIDISDIPRTTKGMVKVSSSVGKKIKKAKLQPGDWIFYGNEEGVVDHVAMYIGDGQVIQARGKAYGVVITSMYYRTPLYYMNFLDYNK